MEHISTNPGLCDCATLMSACFSVVSPSSTLAGCITEPHSRLDD